jgi:hypothetical protein
MHALFKMRLNPIIKTKPQPLSGPFRTGLAKLCVQKATTTMNSKRAPEPERQPFRRNCAIEKETPAESGKAARV